MARSDARTRLDLWRGARLAGASEATSGALLTTSEREFLDASEASERADEEQTRRQVRRLRMSLVGVGVALVIALVAGLVATRQREPSRHGRRTCSCRERDGDGRTTGRRVEGAAGRGPVPRRAARDRGEQSTGRPRHPRRAHVGAPRGATASRHRCPQATPTAWSACPTARVCWCSASTTRRYGTSTEEPTRSSFPSRIRRPSRRVRTAARVVVGDTHGALNFFDALRRTERPADSADRRSVVRPGVRSRAEPGWPSPSGSSAIPARWTRHRPPRSSTSRPAP